MPYRKFPLVTDEIYHVFNRSIDKLPIFVRIRDLNRILEVSKFYSFQETQIRFSHFNRLYDVEKSEHMDRLKKTSVKQIEILSFCFMPNHYHFLIKQLEDNGISSFIRKVQDSYAKYFNTKYKRTGSLFQSNFKAIRIDDEDQLLHVSRYIHLNPLTSYLISDINSLENYTWSSYRDYLRPDQSGLTNPEFILKFFKNIKHFKKFSADQIGYQRKLGLIKHLLFKS